MNFETGGTLTVVDVAVGEKVKAGEVLAKIDPTDADDALKEAEDSVQVAESALADAEAGGTTSQLEQNQASMTSSELQLTSDQGQPRPFRRRCPKQRVRSLAIRGSDVRPAEQLIDRQLDQPQRQLLERAV